MGATHSAAEMGLGPISCGGKRSAQRRKREDERD